MSGWPILRREVKAIARLPQTYGIAAAYLVISGIFFVNILVSTEIPDLGQYYANIASTLLVLAPIVAMRSFAEERRSGALDVTLSWPVSRPALVLARFVANTLFVWVLASIVWLYYGLVAGFASISFGRTAGGWIGLLLLSMAFNALALGVSARASSPAAAAFLGFGLLLVLWILDYAPGWIGATLRSFGPAAHFEPFSRGVLYGNDAAYFLVVTLAGLGAAVAALQRHRPGTALASLARRGAAVGVVVGLSAGGVAMAGQVEGELDLTPTKQNTVSPVTRHVVRTLPGPVRLTAFVEPISPDAATFRNLVRLYRAAGATIDADAVDPDVAPARARDAGATVYGQVLVEVGGRRELIDSADQVALTGALHRMSAVDKPRACFTVGHGERDLTDESRHGLSALAGDLRRLFFDVAPIALAADGAAAALERCAVVVAAGPQVAFLPDELALLDRYVREDGRLLVFADGRGRATDGLNGLLGPWGLALRPGAVSDLSSLAGDRAAIVSDDYPSNAPPVVHLREQHLPVVLVDAVSVEAVPTEDDGDTDGFTPLVRSSAKSWAEPDGGGGRRTGPFVLAALADRGRVTTGSGSPAVARTRIGVVGSADVAANRVLELLGNREFVTGLVQWIARQDDLIAAGRAPTGFYKIVLTDAQKRRLVREGVVVPALLVLVPLPPALLRLRRG